MKISNETKVGILAVVAITLMIIGFNYLKGKNIFTHEKRLFAVFNNLGSLQKSNEVKINGLPVGVVYDYTEIDKNLSGIIVTITMKRDVNIPNDSRATIESELLGNTFINIHRGISDVYLGDHDTLETDRASSLLGDVKDQINPTLGKFREAVDSIKMVLSGIARLFEKETKGNVMEIIENLKNATAKLDNLMNENGELAGTLKNAQSVTANLKKNNDSITATISSIRKTADKFSSLELQPAIDSLQLTISDLRTMLTQLNTGDNTLGLLMRDRELYDRLNATLLSAEILLDDVRLHPKRYTGNIIFNRKDRTGPLTSPAKKDSIPQGEQE